jgi:hypothetical protein
LSRFGLPRLWAFITSRPELGLGRGLNQSCSSCPELSNAMSHSRCRRLEEVDSRLLVVGSQKSGIDLFSTSELRVQYVVGKISTRATSLVQTLLRSDAAVRSYELPKSRDSTRDNFGTPTRESREKVTFGRGCRGVSQSIL